MSLTTELQKSDSILSQWLSEHIDYPTLGRLIAYYNWHLNKIEPLYRSGYQPALVGTAFDYLFRWDVQPLVDYKLAALLGAVHVNKGDTVREIVRIGNDDPDELRIKACVVLAWYEMIFRGNGTKQVLKRHHHDAKKLIGAVSEPDYMDLEMLRKTIHPVWGEINTDNYIPNPTFMGSNDVQGADADWIIDGCLYDCKTTRVKNPLKIDMLKQIICYALLDYQDEYKINSIGVYLVRYKKIIRFSFKQLFGDKDIHTLRSDLALRFKQRVN